MNLFKTTFFCLFVVFGLRLNALGAPIRTVVYVSNADSRDITVLELNPRNGDLKFVEKVTVLGSVMPLTISPDRRFLFASLRSQPFAVSSFRIDPRSGRLSALKTSPLADNMAYLSTDRSGRFLLGASYSGDKISVNAINSRGEVADKPLSVWSTGRNAHSLVADPSNRFLFASILGSDQITQFRFNAKTGHIRSNVPPFLATTKGAGPRHLVFHRDLRFAFGSNELDGTISTYQLAKTGTLTPLNAVSMMPPGSNAKPWAADLHLTPNGRFLFASERTTSTIAGFRVAKSGALTPIGHFPTETQPRGFNIDPRGHFLLAVGQKSGALSAYRINPNGALQLLSRHAVGQGPNWVEIVELPT